MQAAIQARIDEGQPFGDKEKKLPKDQQASDRWFHEDFLGISWGFHGISWIGFSGIYWDLQ